MVLDAELSEIRKDFGALRTVPANNPTPLTQLDPKSCHWRAAPHSHGQRPSSLTPPRGRAVLQLTRKYGEFWNRPLAQLKKARAQKENLLKECAPPARLPARLPACPPASPAPPPAPALTPTLTLIPTLTLTLTLTLTSTLPHRIKFQMELFNLHIQQGRDLCSKVGSTRDPSYHRHCSGGGDHDLHSTYYGHPYLPCSCLSWRRTSRRPQHSCSRSSRSRCSLPLNPPLVLTLTPYPNPNPKALTPKP